MESNDQAQANLDAPMTDLPPVLGSDGLATFALSCAVIVASVGLSLVAAVLHVIRVGMAATPAPAVEGRVLVLGYRLSGGRHVPAIYRARLDRAVVLLQRAPTVQVFLLGGRPRPELPSEASIGATYLVRAGVDPGRIRQEDRSRHTLENLSHYRASFPDDPSDGVILVSSRFHLARVMLIAGGLELKGEPCAAETTWLALFRRPDLLLTEALMVHWYIVGRSFSRWTGNRHMLARIS